jgi:hypothetical protein
MTNIKINHDELRLIDPKQFNLKSVANRSYQIFDPVSAKEKSQLGLLLDVYTDVIYPHIRMVRELFDVGPDDEFSLARPYPCGDTAAGEIVFVVIDAKIRGSGHGLTDDGWIDGTGKGHWYAVLCPEDAIAQFEADIEEQCAWLPFNEPRFWDLPPKPESPAFPGFPV